MLVDELTLIQFKPGSTITFIDILSAEVVVEIIVDDDTGEPTFLSRETRGKA
jgi:hypothetical protein